MVRPFIRRLARLVALCAVALLVVCGQQGAGAPPATATAGTAPPAAITPSPAGAASPASTATSIPTPLPARTFTPPVVASSATAGTATFTVSPRAGPPGTTFTVAGTGVPAFNRRCGATVEVTDAASQIVRRRGIVYRVGEDGAFTATVDSAGYAPGDYTVTILYGYVHTTGSPVLCTPRQDLPDSL